MLTKKDAKMAQGLAIIGMVALHLFCRIDNLPYNVHIFLGGRPLIYYIGLFGDFCVPIYCFCSGYSPSQDDPKNTNQQNYKTSLFISRLHLLFSLAIF